MRTSHLLTMIGAAGALTLASAPSAQPEAVKAPPPHCFFSTDWEGWKATRDDKSIYIRVRLRDIYRLDLSTPCPDLHWPDAHLITNLHGGTICNALDIDLKVAQGRNFPTSCIVSKLTQLTPAEASALPKELQP